MFGPLWRLVGPVVLGLGSATLLIACAVGGEAAEPQDAIGDETPTEQTGQTGQTEPGQAGEARPVEGRAVGAELIRVIDGDSLELEIDGEEVEVRLLDVNAPELYGPAGPGDGDKTCNGLAAKDALALLLEDERLAVTGSETDRFGRLLADVTAGERSTTVDMIELGWGLATGENAELRDRMKQAAGDRVGMWGDLCGTPQAFGLAIGETQVDPAGSDRENLNDEWVTIVNENPEPVDLSGWTIRDDTTSHRYLMQSILKPGNGLTVRSGSGSSTDGDLYLNETFPVWSNRGETVLLLDPKGVVAAWAFIDPPADR